MYGEMSFDAVDHRNTFFGRKKRGEELHNARIGIQSDKWITIRDEPLPEDQAITAEDCWLVHTVRLTRRFEAGSMSPNRDGPLVFGKARLTDRGGTGRCWLFSRKECKERDSNHANDHNVP